MLHTARCRGHLDLSFKLGAGVYIGTASFCATQLKTVIVFFFFYRQEWAVRYEACQTKKRPRSFGCGKE